MGVIIRVFIFKTFGVTHTECAVDYRDIQTELLVLLRFGIQRETLSVFAS